MKIILFFIYVPFVYSDLHTFMTTYTGIRRDRTAGTSEFSAVTTVDGHHTGYFDNNEKQVVPKPSWVKFIVSKGLQIDNPLISENVQTIYKNNMNTLMQTFHRLNGVHQGMYGCARNEGSSVIDVFHHYAYDGQDFINLDVKNSMYIASAPEAKHIVEEWNNDREQIETLKAYYEYQCTYWLWKFVNLNEDAYKRTVPRMFLLQKSPDADVKCHVTDFYSKTTVILWRKNGQDINPSSALVKSGVTLPNEDGSFQRTSVLNVSPDDWKENQYSCVVKHMENTIQKILIEENVKSNNKIPVVLQEPTKAAYFSMRFTCMCVIIVFIVLFFFLKKTKLQSKYV